MSKEQEKYKGVHGFKNGAPAYDKNNAWTGVQLFLDTWGFLPNDDSVLEKLDKKQLIKLCNFALGSACRIDVAGDGIKAVQKLMDEFGISPEKLTGESHKLK